MAVCEVRDAVSGLFCSRKRFFFLGSSGLEKVQLFATRIASNQWNHSSEQLNDHFNLPTLSCRCAYFKLLLFYILSEGFFLSLWSPYPHLSPNQRVTHNKQFIQPFARTVSLLSEDRLFQSLTELMK